MIPILLSALLLPLSSCQTFPGFLYQTGTQLVVDFNGTLVNYPGQSLLADQVQSAPTVGLKELPADDGPFLFVFIDPTPYGDNGTLDALHTIQTDLTLSSSLTHISNSSFYALTSAKPPVAPYIAPDPIVGPATHHYTQLLFRQPRNFSIPEEFRYALPLNLKNYTNRLAFSLPKFVDAAGLGEPVAANYFDLGGSSSSSSSSSNGTLTRTPSAPSPTAYASAAVRSFASRSSFLLLLLSFVTSVWSVGL
ncbi:hypothetical protein VTN77DRAFT_1989 [Rasamsonia byssochlamydoides]|uniref:uncharacterized protein n=1 Tax=Rasamsonia byssochlamydoides TaxID=89139 RepID=UPI0037420793